MCTIIFSIIIPCIKTSLLGVRKVVVEWVDVNEDFNIAKSYNFSPTDIGLSGLLHNSV